MERTKVSKERTFDKKKKRMMQLKLFVYALNSKGGLKRECLVAHQNGCFRFKDITKRVTFFILEYFLFQN